MVQVTDFYRIQIHFNIEMQILLVCLFMKMTKLPKKKEHIAFYRKKKNLKET